MMIKKFYLSIFLFTLVNNLSAQYSIKLTTGNTSYEQSPVRVELPKQLDRKKSYELFNAASNTKIPVQLSGNKIIIFITPSLPANTTQSFLLRPGKANADRVVLKENGDGIEADVNNKPVFFYHTKTVMPPVDSPAYYQRSGFIHPLYSPNGEIITDDFPAGHAHQHALFAAWTNTTFKNTFIDFWNQHLKKGTVEHVKVLSKQSGDVFGKLDVLLRYRSLEFGEVLLEKWSIIIYPFSDYFLFDIESVQTNTSKDTLHLNKYHYGGMGLRGSKYWNPVDQKNYHNDWSLVTNEGIKDSAANHTHVKWVDASGKIFNNEAGVTVFDHPSNFRYPQAVRVHPTMPYFVFAPVVDGAFTIDPGQSYKSAFRYYVHNGMPDIKKIEAMERSYSEPVKVQVSEK